MILLLDVHDADKSVLNVIGFVYSSQDITFDPIRKSRHTSFYRSHLV